MTQLISLVDVDKSYFVGDEEQGVLRQVNLQVRQGEMLAILGPSGSGKTTLMNILGCLDVPTRGEYHLDGVLVANLTEPQLARIRNKKVGFVFQNFQLLPRLTAFSNIELPLIYSHFGLAERRDRVMNALEAVGIPHKALSRPNQLSGGQQQRVAIARAMVTEPAVILADEPTGALDQKTGQQVMELFKQFNALGRTIIMITHDPSVAQHARRVVRILDGQIFEEGDDRYAQGSSRDVSR
ncbi:MAG: ABC transporter ATP-binding protein [Firmicutes bacterium]|nr:ABC transporter ATP-binding protein [Dethiobacter sp.]MBS3888011.1 ABC transporter ATP-binding protein [Bacillota bacterium]MBS4055407.1 ABC transporter ATP-binding protein [Thermaerobacter sp.]